MTTAPRTLNRYDLLKVAALIAMTIGHLGAFQFGDAPWMRLLDRIAAPTFLFLAGYNGRYAFRWPLLAAALVVTLGDGLLSDLWSPQNILWTILLGRMLLGWLDTHPIKPHWIVLACAVWYVPGLFLFDASTLGFVWMLFGRAMRQTMHGRDAMLYGAVGFFGAALQLVLFFDWPAALCGLGVVLLALWFWGVLWRFRPAPMVHDNAVLRFWSRHSLAYYVMHKLLLHGIHV